MLGVLPALCFCDVAGQAKVSDWEGGNGIYVLDYEQLLLLHA